MCAAGRDCIGKLWRDVGFLQQFLGADILRQTVQMAEGECARVLLCRRA
jgi:hypothetical protein